MTWGIIMDTKIFNNQDYNKIIGSNIRFERQKRDLTIEELSEILSIAPGFLGLIERGQRGTSIRNLCRISEFFSISLDQLITQPAGTLILSEEELSKEREQNAVLKDRHSTALSLIQGLTTFELDFLIDTIKSMKKLTNKTVRLPVIDIAEPAELQLDVEEL